MAFAKLMHATAGQLLTWVREFSTVPAVPLISRLETGAFRSPSEAGIFFKRIYIFIGSHLRWHSSSFILVEVAVSVSLRFLKEEKRPRFLRSRANESLLARGSNERRLGWNAIMMRFLYRLFERCGICAMLRRKIRVVHDL